MKINRRRKRAIEKAEKQLDKHEQWKEHILVIGGSLRKDENGNVYGVMPIPF